MTDRLFGNAFFIIWFLGLAHTLQINVSQLEDCLFSTDLVPWLLIVNDKLIANIFLEIVISGYH